MTSDSLSLRGVDAVRSRAALAKLRRVVALTFTLAAAEFRLKYLDSRLSYAWAVLRPLSLFVVMYVVFTQVGRFDDGVEHYGVYLLTALVLWTFFAQGTASAVPCLVRQGKILRKLPLPPIVIPLSLVLTAMFDLAMNLIAVGVLIVLTGVAPRLGWLELPLLLLLLSILVTGIGLLLSTLFVRYRDVAQIWRVIRQLLFYGSPIFYVIAALPEGVERTAVLNPLATIFTQMRHVLIDPEAPTAAAAAGGTARLLIPLGIIFGSFALGAWVFARHTARVAERM